MLTVAGISFNSVSSATFVFSSLRRQSGPREEKKFAQKLITITDLDEESLSG